MRALVFRLLFIFLAFSSAAGENARIAKDPLTVAKLIGDKLVRETPFAYRMELAAGNNVFNSLRMIDFGRSFPSSGEAVAYAYTQLVADRDMEMELHLGHNDGCSVWINGILVYDNGKKQSLNITYDERSIELPFRVYAKLKKGNNTLLIQSATKRSEWRVYLQPPSGKGAVPTEQVSYPEIGLHRMKSIDKQVSDISCWLLLGPFRAGQLPDSLLSSAGEPVIGQVFQGAAGTVSWTIPKVDVVGNLIDPLPWGTNYHWNYHNGGLALAMKMMGEMTGEARYGRYADDFCDFQLRSIPFIRYETETLGLTDVPNGLLVNTPLLDFTLAPALPFIYRLRKEADFLNREAYEAFVNAMLRYAREEQIRLPGLGIYTRTTPRKYTTWVDDMFMGIPFLIQAAQFVENESDKKYFLDDASNQVLGFNKEVWDKEAGLYVHARYSGETGKMVHWSRANGWGIWATMEVLSHLPRNHPNYKKILEHYRQHVKSLMQLQDEDGFWRNVLDHPESRQEVSGTAIFTMAIARGLREGWLKGKSYREAVDKGWRAIVSQVESDGTVHNICYGTMCSSDVNYYLNRPFYDNDTHGLFAVLFAAMEVSKLKE
jgi:rhamnogalacturonyl hydrolase YesR